MSDNTIVIGNKTFKAVPCSCRCGGSWAWVEINDGLHTMIGCVCHHTLPVNASDSSGILSLYGTVVQISNNTDVVELVPDDCLCDSWAASSLCPVHERYGV